MFNDRHYVPILKGREGEYSAMQALDGKLRGWITPLFEVPPVPWDFVNETPAKTLDKHLATTPEKLFGAWGRTKPLFVDFLWVPPGERMQSGHHPVTHLLAGTRKLGLQVIPVTGPERDADYQKAVRDAIAADHLGACIRVDNDYLGDLSGLATELAELQKTLGVGAKDLDLLIDLKEVTPRNEALIVTGMNAVLSSLPQLSEWRTLTLAAAAFPENLSDIPAGSVAKIPRADWSLWLTLRNSKPARIPTFGDYAIAHPEPTEIDPRLMRMSANLRYTRPDLWLVFKGRNVRDFGYEQFQDLCADLVARKGDYDGSGHCWADEFIEHCSQRKAGPGNATTWRKVGTNHHLARVVGDLQAL
jgi:Beta protein